MKTNYVEIIDVGKVIINTEEIDDSNLQDKEVFIETYASMISAGTELSRVFALKKGFSYPVRPGYCSVGKVLKKGTGLDDISVGDLVYFNAPHAQFCRTHRSTRVQDACLYKLDASLDPVEATIINLGLVALGGVNSTTTKLNDKVIVFGAGNIGIITAILYQTLGCKVLLVDPVENRCEKARQMGIVNTYSGPEAINRIKEFTNNVGADITVDVTGNSQAIMDAISACTLYGQVLLLGSPRVSLQADVSTVFSQIHMKDLKVLGGFNQLAPAFPVEGSNNSVVRNYQIISQLIKDKTIDVRKLISHVIKPQDVETSYHGLMYDKEHYQCVVIDWR